MTSKGLSLTHGLLIALAWSLLGAVPEDPPKPGTYGRRQGARGELTDLSPKLARRAFVEDRYPDERRLAAFVDAATAATWQPGQPLGLRVGLAHRGVGPKLPLRPDRFRLRLSEPEVEDEPRELVSLTHQERIRTPGGRHLLRKLTPLLRRDGVHPFDGRDGTRAGVYFHAAPDALNPVDEGFLHPNTWFETWVVFVLPDDVTSLDQRLELLVLVGDDEDEERARVAFRVEVDPELHRDAFRRARKGRARQDKALRKELKQQR
ncbi:MAG: hypothetical protein AAF533_14695 [Acidobacteriota bacterium]